MSYQHLPNQTFSLGDFELTIISDGLYYLDGGAMFGVVPKTLWERRMAQSGAAPDAKNRLHLSMNSVLVRTGEQNVLIETGMGNKHDEKQKSIFEQEEKLLHNLQQTGLGPEDIDVVINSHLHFDHCGWNTVYRNGKAVATFPKARYYSQRQDWEHANRQHERDRVSFINDNYNPLVENGQMTLLEGDHQIAPGVRVKVFRGHTQAMQAVYLESGGQTAVYISDLIPTTWHMDLTWVMAYDLFPLDSVESRKVFYAEALPQEWVVLFTHDPLTPVCRVRSSKGKLEAVPVTVASGSAG